MSLSAILCLWLGLPHPGFDFAGMAGKWVKMPDGSLQGEYDVYECRRCKAWFQQDARTLERGPVMRAGVASKAEWRAGVLYR